MEHINWPPRPWILRSARGYLLHSLIFTHLLCIFKNFQQKYRILRPSQKYFSLRSEYFFLSSQECSTLSCRNIHLLELYFSISSMLFLPEYCESAVGQLGPTAQVVLYIILCCELCECKSSRFTLPFAVGEQAQTISAALLGYCVIPRGI